MSISKVHVGLWACLLIMYNTRFLASWVQAVFEKRAAT